MAGAIAAASEKPKRKKGFLVLAVATMLLGGGGFASTYLGLWSPASLIAARAATDATSVPEVQFVDIPTIELHMPGSPARTLILSASVETDAAQVERVRHLMPRIRDAFNGFLSGVDRSAYDKRGVLEIIRAELLTRTRYVLGEDTAKDLLITEFRIR